MEISKLPAQFPSTPARFRRNTYFTILSTVKTSPFRHPKVSSVKSESVSNKLKPESPNRMFILGMGYVGQYFARELKNQGWDVSGTCLSATKKKELELKGLDVHLFNACRPQWEILDILRCYTHLLVSIPPVQPIGDPMLHHEEHLRTLLENGNIQWLCYLSSTSVYGDYKGAWVNEDDYPKPTSESAKVRLNAEKRWIELGKDIGLSAYIFRLGGIYGPGRSAIDTILNQQLLSDRQRRRASRQYTSRVHVADICQALKASIAAPIQRKTYNIVDDDPAPRAEVFAFAQQLIKKSWQDLILQTDHSIDRTRPSDVTRGEKRVSNARMKNELGVRLLHPSYRSGLQSIIDDMENPVSL